MTVKGMSINYVEKTQKTKKKLHLKSKSRFWKQLKKKKTTCKFAVVHTKLHHYV